MTSRDNISNFELQFHVVPTTVCVADIIVAMAEGGSTDGPGVSSSPKNSSTTSILDKLKALKLSDLTHQSAKREAYS